MKTKNISKIIILVSLILGAIQGFAIDDSVIFENIDSQNALHKQMNNSPEESVQMKGALDKRIVVEERSKSYAAPSNEDIFKFDKEKVTAKTAKKMNKKKKETLAKELKELVD